VRGVESRVDVPDAARLGAAAVFQGSSVDENLSRYPLDCRLNGIKDGSGLGIGKGEAVSAAEDDVLMSWCLRRSGRLVLDKHQLHSGDDLDIDRRASDGDDGGDRCPSRRKAQRVRCWGCYHPINVGYAHFHHAQQGGSQRLEIIKTMF
jgi:hypothetical protein